MLSFIFSLFHNNLKGLHDPHTLRTTDFETSISGCLTSTCVCLPSFLRPLWNKHIDHSRSTQQQGELEDFTQQIFMKFILCELLGPMIEQWKKSNKNSCRPGAFILIRGDRNKPQKSFRRRQMLWRKREQLRGLGRTMLGCFNFK